MMMMTRGLRNNNPLNIRRSSEKWQGLSAIQADSAFFTFKSLAYGYRAAIRTLQTYQGKYKLRTVRELISRWAPPSENDTGSYIATVCKLTGFTADKRIDTACRAEMLELVAAMARVENGTAFRKEEQLPHISEGWKLLG